MKIPKEISEFNFPFGTLFELENGFLLYRFHSDILLDVDDVRMMIKAHREMSNGTARYVIVETAPRMSTTPAARELDNKTDRSEITRAEALIVNNIATRIAAKFYYSVMPPPYPVKLFKNTLEGYKWLLKLEYES